MSALTKGTHMIIDEDALQVDVGSTVVEEDAPIGGTVASTVIDEDVDPMDKLPKTAIQNSDGSVTLTLGYPRSIESRKDGKVRTTSFDKLTFHRLVGADQRAIMATSEENMSVVAFSRATRINQAVMNALYDRMDASDIQNAAKVLNYFLTSGPKTGA